MIIMESGMEAFMKIMDSILVLMFIGTGFMYFHAMMIPSPCSCFGLIK